MNKINSTLFKKKLCPAKDLYIVKTLKQTIIITVKPRMIGTLTVAVFLSDHERDLIFKYFIHYNDKFQ